MAITIGYLTIDDEVIEKQLKNDFRDDWFPDAIGYDDYFRAGLLSSIIGKNYSDNHGMYQPSTAFLFNIPKANFTLRYALETSLTDRAIYHALAVRLLPQYDGFISWRVFSHRLDTATAATEAHRSHLKYTFRNGIAAWQDFLGCVNAKLAPNKVLLSTDLANYFENINLRTLRDEMLALVSEMAGEAHDKATTRGQVGQLFTYLSRWAFTEDKGLPQNRDASSFLANLYMRSVDQAMIEQGYEYFRYMDDIKIVCDDEAAARGALKRLILALRPVGQFVNSGKTSIVSTSDREKIREYLGSGSDEMKKIDSAWKTKSLKPIARSFLPLKTLALQTLHSRRYDSREFRFCIGRLETLARCKEFNVPAGYFADVTPLVMDGLDRAPVATDQICRYLRAVDLTATEVATLVQHLTEPSKCLYNWKNYQIWILLTQKGFRSEPVSRMARDIIAARGDDPTRAGASIYLGAIGSQEDRLFIAAHFHSLSSFLGQRAALIAVQEVHFKSREKGGVCINDHVGPHLREDLKGSYRALRRGGKYVLPLKPVSITHYVDLERDYD